MAASATPQRAHQDPGHGSRAARNPRSHRCGHQRERDAAVLARALSRRCARLHGRLERARRGRPAAQPPRLRRELLPEPHRLRGGQAAGRPRGARPARGAHPARQGGDRQRLSRVRDLRRDDRHPAVAGVGGARCAASTAAVGVNLHQGSKLQSDQVCRGAGGARHGQHHAARDTQCLSAPGQAGAAS